MVEVYHESSGFDYERSSYIMKGRNFIKNGRYIL